MTGFVWITGIFVACVLGGIWMVTSGLNDKREHKKWVNAAPETRRWATSGIDTHDANSNILYGVFITLILVSMWLFEILPGLDDVIECDRVKEANPTCEIIRKLPDGEWLLLEGSEPKKVKPPIKE